MEQTKVAVIGCGNIAKNAHVPSYSKNPAARIEYLVDINPEKAQTLKEQYGCENAKVITDYRQALADPAVDAVSVCLPNSLHMPVTVDALNAGKHVLCEKPISVSLENAIKMKEAADKNGRILNIGVVNRFNTAVNKIREMIENGELGEVYHVYASFRSHRSIPGLGGWFTTKAMSGGGVLIDWGVHFLDLILYCTGSPKPVSVTGSAFSKLGKDMKGYTYVDMWAGPPDYSGTYDVDDSVTGMIRTCGPTITFNGAWAQNLNESAMFIEFLGDRGGIKLQYGGNFTYHTFKNGMLCDTAAKFNQKDMFYEELDAFLESARTGKKSRGSIDNVLITQQILDAIYLSSEQNREITL